MENKPNYYAVIPANVRYDKELKDKAKLLYGEIVALSNKEGYCWATNNYFAELYGVSKMTISRLIQELAKRKYIDIEMKYKEDSKEIVNRYIKISIYPIYKNIDTPIYKKLKDNNTSINNTSINNKENIKRKFIKPTIEQIKEYCLERNNNVDSDKFFNYYEANGWVQGKSCKPIKDWKACVRTWEQKSKSENPKWFNDNITKEEMSEEELEELRKELNL
jgi:hypothetical protein